VKPAIATLVLLAALTPASAAPTIQDTIEAVAASKLVDGEVVGFADSPGVFYERARLVLARGTRADHVALLEHESPTVRALGLQCLVWSLGDRAVPILRARLADPGRFTFRPAGCASGSTSVGTLAFALLLDRDYLRARENPSPMLLADELTPLCVEVLARDDTADIRHHHEPVGVRYDAWRPFRGLTDRSLADLRAACPRIPPWRILKGVGRLPGSLPLLRAALMDETLSRRARLAAASALTRRPRDDVLALLRERRHTLDGPDSPGAGSRILRIAEGRRSRKWGAGPGGYDALEDWLLYDALFPESTPEERRARIAALEALAACLVDHVSAWDTDTDLPYRIRVLLAKLDWDSPADRPEIPADAARRIRALVDRHLASRRE